LTAHHELGPIRDGDVHIVNCYSGKDRRMSDLDMVVFVTVPTPNGELLAPLQVAGDFAQMPIRADWNWLKISPFGKSASLRSGGDFTLIKRKICC